MSAAPSCEKEFLGSCKLDRILSDELAFSKRMHPIKLGESMLCDYLVEFVAVARERSFSRAAQVLFISPSSVNRHMDALEADCKVQLFKRGPKGVSLTENGRFLLNKASEIVELLNVVSENFNVTVQEQDVTVCGVSDYPLYVWAMTKAGNDLSTDHLTVSTRFVLDTSVPSIIEALTEGTIDIYVTPAADEILGRFSDDFEVFDYAHDDLMVITTVTHPLASHESIGIADLRSQKILHSEGHFYSAFVSWKEIKRICADAGFSCPVSRTVDLESGADWYSLDFGNDILLIPSRMEILRYFQTSEKFCCTPLADADFCMLAICRKDDMLAANLIKRATPFVTLVDHTPPQPSLVNH